MRMVWALELLHLKQQHWYLRMNIISNCMMMNTALKKTGTLQSMDKAHSFGKEYRAVLSRLLELALNDKELIRKARL